MRKKILLLLLIINTIFCFSAMSEEQAQVYNQKSLFGIKKGDVIITQPIYKKLIKLGNNSYIAFKKNRYGIIDNNGETILDFKFSHAGRFMGKYAKLKSRYGYGLYDEFGKEIISPDKETLEMFSKHYFLVQKNYKYGIIDNEGYEIIKCVCDDIDYVDFTKSNIIRIKYKNEWYEIEQLNSKELNLPKDMQNIDENSGFRITKLVTNPINMTKYSAISTADYSLKIISSISPAYEATIDELILSQGADAISIVMKIGWLPKFPFLYAKNYWHIFKNPNNGPLSEVKNNVKNGL